MDHKGEEGGNRSEKIIRYGLMFEVQDRILGNNLVFVELPLDGHDAFMITFPHFSKSIFLKAKKEERGILALIFNRRFNEAEEGTRWSDTSLLNTIIPEDES